MPKTTNHIELRNNDAVTLPLTSAFSYYELKSSHFLLDIASCTSKSNLKFMGRTCSRRITSGVFKSHSEKNICRVRKLSLDNLSNYCNPDTDYTMALEAMLGMPGVLSNRQVCMLTVTSKKIDKPECLGEVNRGLF